ncbi:MAG: DUF721 domain-containing protein [Candidatus Riflebacteria bacterium]|nr:DUF721 domain-containing protein [Candidatus Riflebacteria bacterium]
MKPTPLGQALKRTLRAFKGRGKDIAKAARITSAWTRIVGEWMASQSRPVEVRGDRLKVGFSSPVWMTEAEYLSDQLIANLDEVLGKGAITHLSFCLLASIDPRWAQRIGPGRSDEPADPIPEPVLTDDQNRRLEQHLLNIPDPSLRDRMRRILKKALTRS